MKKHLYTSSHRRCPGNFCSSTVRYFRKRLRRKLLCIVVSCWLLYLLVGFEIGTVSTGIAHIQKSWITNRIPGFDQAGRNLSVSVNMSSLNSRYTEPREKLILTYGTLYDKKDWEANFSHCEYNKCIVTTTLSDLPRSDAVLISAAEMNSRTRLPLRGPDLQDQIRVFYMMESPGVFTTQFNMDVFDNLFNWTMTYRLDSDIPVITWRFIPLKQPLDPLAHVPPTIESLKRKNLVAALISRCYAESGRSDYIAEFRQFAPLDYYGECGYLPLRMDIDMYAVIGPMYKFWFAFEGALCQDYITEKFFKPMRHGVVPVVLGSGPYSKVAPNGSYINTRDFESPKALAQYLLYLDRHPEEYLKYFSWMKYYRLVDANSPELYKNSWCLLCKKLHLQKGRKWYPRIQDWYRRNNTSVSLCERPPLASHIFSSMLQRLYNTYNVI